MTFDGAPQLRPPLATPLLSSVLPLPAVPPGGRVWHISSTAGHGAIILKLFWSHTGKTVLGNFVVSFLERYLTKKDDGTGDLIQTLFPKSTSRFFHKVASFPPHQEGRSRPVPEFKGRICHGFLALSPPGRRESNSFPRGNRSGEHLGNCMRA